MAALQNCLLSFSPAAFSPARTAAFTSPAATILSVSQRRDRHFPRLSTHPRKPLPPLTSSAPLRPRRLPDLAVRAHGRGGGGQPYSDHFHEEKEHIMEHYMDIISIDHGYLYAEATAMSARVCLSANDALRMASHVMDSAELKLGAPNEISTETIHTTIRTCANAFSGAAEDSYKRTVNMKTVIKFLGALRGLAAVSHILLDGALEAISHKLPKDSLSEYSFNSDVKAIYGEFTLQMSELEDRVRSSSAMEICNLALPTILRGMEATEMVVGLMVARRQRALQNAQTKLVV